MGRAEALTVVTMWEEDAKALARNILNLNADLEDGDGDVQIHDSDWQVLVTIAKRVAKQKQ
jgi:hypothetical protein